MLKTKIGFIGAGNMAGAIISGAISSGYIIPKHIYIYDINETSISKLSGIGVNFSSCINDMCKCCEIIFLCVKPQVYSTILPELAENIEKSTIVSIAAGKTIDYVKHHLKQDTPVIRVMPNTPLLIGKGVTSVCASPEVNLETLNIVTGLFSACGITIAINERDFDIATAAGGSLPAFVYRFIGAAVTAAVERGLSESDARLMVCNTVIGAAELAVRSDAPIDNMIALVASPGGTTVAGLGALDAHDFDKSVVDAVSAAYNRSKEL